MKSVEKSLTKDLHFVFIYRNLSAIQKFKYTWMSFYKMTVAYLESEKNVSNYGLNSASDHL